MSDARLDPATHDLVVANGGSLVHGDEDVAQRCKIRISLHRGEWFAKRGKGVPWRTVVMGKSVDEDAAKAVIRDELLDVPGVVRVGEVTLERDGATRRATMAAPVHTADGTDTTATGGA